MTRLCQEASPGQGALDLATRLVNVADALVEGYNTQISDDTIRGLREEIATARRQLSETTYAIDYQATCLIECIAAMAYARSDGDKAREQRACMYINSLRTFLRIDRDKAERGAA